MKRRYVNWQGIRDLKRPIIWHLLMLGFCFVVPSVIGHIPLHHYLGISPPLSIVVYWASGFLYSAVFFVFIAILGAIAYGSCMAFGFLFPVEENEVK